MGRHQGSCSFYKEVARDWPMRQPEMKISVVTVCRNSSQHIGRCLASVAAQTYPDLEHIVVDGASTDGTLAIIEQHARQHPRSLRFSSQPDRGIYDAMNRGLAQSSGELVAFLNSDDFYWHPDCLSWMAGLSQQHDSDFYVAQTLIHSQETGRTLSTRHRQVNRFYLFKRCLPQPSTFYRRRAFEKAGEFSLRFRLAADYEWFLRALLKSGCQAAFCSVLTTAMPVGGASTQAANQERVENELTEIRNEHFGRLEQRLYRNRLLDFVLDYDNLRNLSGRLPLPWLRQIGQDLAL